MARRRERQGAVDDLLAFAAKLPWWASLLIALVSYVLLHSIANQDVGTATSTKDIGAVATRGLYQALANLGQYILPLIFVVGALASVLGQRKRRALVMRVAESESPVALGETTWREFEGLVEEAFRLRGYSVRRLGGSARHSYTTSGDVTGALRGAAALPGFRINKESHDFDSGDGV